MNPQINEQPARSRDSRDSRSLSLELKICRYLQHEITIFDASRTDKCAAFVGEYYQQQSHAQVDKERVTCFSWCFSAYSD